MNTINRVNMISYISEMKFEGLNKLVKFLDSFQRIDKLISIEEKRDFLSVR